MIRLALRGSANHQVQFETTLEVRPDKLEQTISRIAAKHAPALLRRKLHWVEIEFLDETDETKRFFDIPGCSRFWSPREDAYVRATYATTPTEQIAAKLNRSTLAVYQTANKLGIKKSQEYYDRPDCRWGFRKGSTIGKEFRFHKGQVPPNKGKKMPGWAPGRMKATQFKKGQQPENWNPVGSLRTNSDGCIEIKIREGTWNAKQGPAWQLYNRYLWEQHHGPIPPKHIVAFKDGNRANCVIENLELLTMKQNRLRNSMWNMYPRELAEVIQLTGVLKRKIRRQDGKGSDRKISGLADSEAAQAGRLAG